MDPLDLLFRAVGAFYLAGGFFGLRAILMDSVLDKALAALSAGQEDTREKRRRQILGVSTVAVCAGGAALMLMSGLALPIFLASLAAQAIWIAGARRFFIPAEDDEPRSVRQNINAAILYAVATLGVVWLWRGGRLGPWDDPVAAAFVLATAIGLGGWFFYHLSWKPASPGSFGGLVDDRPEESPQRIVIEPARWLWPLVDADTDERFNHLTFLPDELAWRVEHWDDVLQNAFDPDDDMTSEPVFASPEAERDYRAEAEAIRRELAAVFGAENVSFGPDWKRRNDPGA